MKNCIKSVFAYTEHSKMELHNGRTNINIFMTSNVNGWYFSWY